MASIPIDGLAFGHITAHAILKRARSEDELKGALAAAELLISECTGIKHQEEGPEIAEAFEREARDALAKTLALFQQQALQGKRSKQ
jgi:hypothetical protein